MLYIAFVCIFCRFFCSLTIKILFLKKMHGIILKVFLLKILRALKIIQKPFAILFFIYEM